MLLKDDGSLVVVRSRPHNRDSYHLAALIAHYFMLDSEGMHSGQLLESDFESESGSINLMPRRRRSNSLAGASTCLR